jgi:hypothetical protein
MEVASSMAAM